MSENRTNVMNVSELSTKIENILLDVCGPPPIPLHAPEFQGNEWKYLKRCLDSSFVSSVGEYVNLFEKELAHFTGSKYAIAVVNGTAAIHIALLLAGVQRNDEVILPALNFVAGANAVTYCGAQPHFVDSCASNLGIDPSALQKWLSVCSFQRKGACINKSTNKPIRALLPMHTFGLPCDMDGLLEVAKKFNLTLIEDAAEALGSQYKGKHVGTFGKAGIISFNGNKIITTGGGGAILTNDRSFAERAKHITTTAKKEHKWEYDHDEVGFNYRMPNINAALGCAQLECIESFIEIKRNLFHSYEIAFEKLEGVKLIGEQLDSKSNYWLHTILLDEENADERNIILEKTNSAGYMTRPVWKLLHKLPHFRHSPRAPLPVAERLEKCLINLPSGAGLL